MPYETGKYPNPIGLRYFTLVLLPSFIIDRLVSGGEQTIGCQRKGS